MDDGATLVKVEDDWMEVWMDAWVEFLGLILMTGLILAMLVVIVYLILDWRKEVKGRWHE